MRKYGCFEIPADKAPVFSLNERALQPAELEGSHVDEECDTISRAGVKIGVMVDGKALEGFATPSRKLEFYSATLKEWGWPEYLHAGLYS